MASKFVVFGASGMAGVAVSKYFETLGKDVVRVSRKEFDIAKSDTSKLAEWITPGSVVVNCAGVIKPQIAKMTTEEVLKVNVLFPRNLAKLAKKVGAKCFHLTTDCVYSGKKGAYTESDFFDADDVYGMSKNGGDTSECMTLRTSIIGQEIGQSRSLISWAMSQQGKAVNGYTNHLWNGVTTLQFAKSVNQILESGLYREGVFHLHSPNTLNKFELLQALSDVYSLNLSITAQAPNPPCDRSLSSDYSLARDMVNKTIREQLVEMKDFFKANF